MKLNKNVFANALALTTVVVWVVCALFVALLPDLSVTIVKWWSHGLDYTALGVRQVTLGGFILGGVTLTIAGWLFGYLLGWSLEYFGKKK